MSNQLILGLGNKARHGKDSFAEAIIRYYGNFDAIRARHGLGLTFRPTLIQKVSFADALYKETNAFLATSMGRRWMDGGLGAVVENGAVIAPIPDHVKPEHPLTDPRAPYGKFSQLLQWWGTDFRRQKFGWDYWVNIAMAGVNSHADIVMFTDMRFLNEAEKLKAGGAVTVQVSRLNQDGTPFVDPSRDPNHKSETELDNYNFDHKISVKTGEVALLDEWAVTLVHYLRARAQKGKP